MNNLSPFKSFVLQNFPYIEADFDALTNYELMCKVVEYLNATIDEVNKLSIEMKTFEEWFDNLDVQDEVDHKLDEMAESGELQEIMSDYLNAKAVFGFANVSAMQDATNLVNGSLAYTYGFTTIGDGGSAKYKIRNVTTEDTIDGYLLIAITDTLVAELIMDDEITPEMFGAIGDGETDDTDAFVRAINTHKKIVSDGIKVYKLDKINTSEDINIENCNFYSDAEESATDVRFLFRTYSYNVKFTNCNFESSFDYIPVINQINGSTDGLASNVIAIRGEHGCEIKNCKFKLIYGIDSRGKTIVDNCNFEDVEMGILTNTTDDVRITNSIFKMNKLVDSQYYHALYIQAAEKSFVADNIVISENDEDGDCGDHLHFKHPSSNSITTPNAIVSNVTINGDLSFSYLTQNNNAKITFENLTYKGTTGGGIQTGQSGADTFINCTINCAKATLFECYNTTTAKDSTFNLSYPSDTGTVRLATRCNLELINTTIKGTNSSLNMNYEIGSLTANMIGCIFTLKSMNSMNVGGNGIVNNILNCVWNLTEGAINLAGRGFTSGIIRNAGYPTSAGTIAEHNGYDFLVYKSNTYFGRLTNISSL